MKSYRAYCEMEPGGLYYDVKVYPTKKAMRAGLRRAWLSDKCDAMCANHVHQKWNKIRFKTMPDIGCLYFHHDSMRVGVICHEAVHAALAWHRAKVGGRVLKLSGTRGGHAGKHEEDVCWVAGNIARQVVLGYRKKKGSRRE